VKSFDQTSPPTKTEEKPPVEFIHTGSTLLNLAASGKGKNGGWARGRIINLVGDGSSGKTLLALELAAYIFYKMVGNKSFNFPQVKRIKIIFDNSEEVMDFPVAQMYGQKFKDGVEWIHSETVQSWGRNVTREIMANKPGELLLYITDSLDALASQEGMERFEKAAKSDKEEDGTYGTEKAAYLSKSFFQNICSMMAGKDCTLLVISQIRQKIGVTFGEKYSRTGGKALDFYTHQVAWLAESEKLKKTFRGEERVYGIRILAKMKRNKTAKPFRESEIVVLFDYGIDDIETGLSYLFGPKAKLINWQEIEYNRQDLIKHIESNNLQDELGKKVEIAWGEIETAIKPDRQKRY
jgi:recombination protein RecA